MQRQKTAGLGGQFLRYVLPSAASQLGMSFYIFADTFFIARGVGPLGIAALNIAIPVYALIAACGAAIGVGAGVIFAVSRGAGDEARGRAAAQMAVGLALGVGALLSVLGFAFAAPIARVMGASDLSLPLAKEYIQVLCSFSIAFLLNNLFCSLVRNDAAPRLVMASMLANSMFNVVMDYIFIMRFGWGMWGAALATGLSPVLGLLILSLHRRNPGRSLHFVRRSLDFSQVFGILRAGGAQFVMEVGNCVVIVLFNRTLMRLSGDMALAAYGIVTNISLLVIQVLIGVGQGIQPIVSEKHGEGNLGDCRRILRMGCATAAILSVGAFAVGQFFPGALAAIFNSEGDPILGAMTTQAIRIHFFSFLFMWLNIICISYSQSVLKARRAVTVSLLRGFGLIVLGVAVLPQLFGLRGVWIITPAAECVTAVVSAVLLFARPSWPARPSPTTKRCSS